MRAMRRFATALFAYTLLAAACSEITSVPASSGQVHDLTAIDNDMKAAHVGLDASRADAEQFVKTHTYLQVCMMNSAALIAVARNQKIDPKSDDIYLVIAYRDDKVSNLDLTPPQFSAGNVATYCH